uniref:carbohydrate ABC transporter permease n=1 Tax=Lancefieldella rimae TaxID=1383 RepID=UPI003A920B53
INGILAQLGIAPVGWLNTMKWSKVPVIILSVWRNTPWYMLIVMSALLGVDMNLYEAARIDGANALQRMFFITLPCIMPVLMFCLMNLTIDSVRIFTEPYILTSGGPGASSMSVIQYLYTSAFDTFKMGYASAMGYILTLFLVFVSVFYFKTLRRQSGV